MRGRERLSRHSCLGAAVSEQLRSAMGCVYVLVGSWASQARLVAISCFHAHVKQWFCCLVGGRKGVGPAFFVPLLGLGLLLGRQSLPSAGVFFAVHLMDQLRAPGSSWTPLLPWTQGNIWDSLKTVPSLYFILRKSKDILRKYYLWVLICLVQIYRASKACSQEIFF